MASTKKNSLGQHLIYSTDSLWIFITFLEEEEQNSAVLNNKH